MISLVPSVHRASTDVLMFAQLTVLPRVCSSSIEGKYELARSSLPLANNAMRSPASIFVKLVWAAVLGNDSPN